MLSSAVARSTSSESSWAGRYRGQGLVAQRRADHNAKSKTELHRQQSHFSAALIWEWVDLDDTHRSQLLEIENDLIASHIITQGAAPSAQFLG